MSKIRGAGSAHWREAGKPPHLGDRAFGLAAFVMLSAIALIRWFFFGGIAKWAVVAAGFFLVVALFAPALLLPLNRLFGDLARRLGVVSNYVVLAPFLWVVMASMGFIMRMAGRDPMHRRFEPDSNSYLTPVGRATTVETLRDMF